MAEKPGIDVLSDVLRTVRLTGALFFPLETSSPWVDEIPATSVFAESVLPGAQHVVSYHIVMRGSCWAALAGQAPVRLEAGDIFVVPHGDPYVMSSAPDLRSDAPLDWVLSFFRQMTAGAAPSVVIEGGGGPERAELGVRIPRLRPPSIQPWTRGTSLFDPPAPAGRCAGSPHARGRVRARRVAPTALRCRLRPASAEQVLFVEVVRRYLDGLAPGQAGWLAGLRDPTVGHALAMLHQRPADAWTLERLARGVGVSAPCSRRASPDWWDTLAVPGALPAAAGLRLPSGGPANVAVVARRSATIPNRLSAGPSQRSWGHPSRMAAQARLTSER